MFSDMTTDFAAGWVLIKPGILGRLFRPNPRGLEDESARVARQGRGVSMYSYVQGQSCSCVAWKSSRYRVERLEQSCGNRDPQPKVRKLYQKGFTPLRPVSGSGWWVLPGGCSSALSALSALSAPSALGGGRARGSGDFVGPVERVILTVTLCACVHC